MQYAPTCGNGIHGYRITPILELNEIQNYREKNMYIHCAQGHGRTGLFTALLLLERGIVSNVEDALALLQLKRPKLRINKRQMEFLQMYWQKQQQENSWTIDEKKM